jgi:hypothetical protein
VAILKPSSLEVRTLTDQRFLNSLPTPTQDERTFGLLAHLLQIFGPPGISVGHRDSGNS